MKHRLPDGSYTRSDKKYVDTWHKVGDWLITHFFPGYFITGFNPTIGLACSTDWGPHQALSLSMTTVISLAHSDAAQRLPDNIKRLLPKETVPALPTKTGYKHLERAAQLITGDLVYVRGEDQPDKWYKAVVRERLYTAYNSHLGYLVLGGGRSKMLTLPTYGNLWSVHPEDHFLCAKNAEMPFKVSRGPWR